jgi:outer membrane lipoprotein-sorting protein
MSFDKDDRRRETPSCVAASRARLLSVRMRGLFRPFVLLGLLVAGCAAVDNVPPTPLSTEDQADVRRAEEYLDGVRTLKARFLQISSNGRTAEGTLYLSRPGRLRLEYDPPFPVLMVANGGVLTRYDRSLNAVTRLPLESTPIGFFVRERIQLSGDITVTQVNRSADGLRITLIQTDKPEEGRIVLTFGNHPFALTSWEIIDARGDSTRIVLMQPSVGVPLDPTLFRFTEPSA